MSIFLRQTDQFIDASGAPVVNGLVYIGVYGQDPKINPIKIYTDDSKVSELPNPMLLDEFGRLSVDVYLDVDYSYMVETSAGTPIEGVKNRRLSTTTNFSSAQSIKTISLIETSANVYEAREGFQVIPPQGSYFLRFPTANTGAVTIEFEDLVGSFPVKDNGSTLSSGAIGINETILADFDGTDFNIVIAASSTISVPIGTCVFYVGSTIPTDYIRFRGQTMGNAASGAGLADNAYQTAFELFKTMAPNAGTEDWASNDTVTLPDARGRMPLPLDEAGTNRVTGAQSKTRGGAGGTDRNTLTQANLPDIILESDPHDHGGLKAAANNTSNSSGDYLGNTRLGSPQDRTYNLSIQAEIVNTPLGGSATPIDNMPPYLAMNFICKVK